MPGIGISLALVSPVTSGTLEVRGIFKKRADDADAKLKALPASYADEKAKVEKYLADLRAANADAAKIKAAEDAVKAFPATADAAKVKWTADKNAANARTGPPRPHATPFPGATDPPKWLHAAVLAAKPPAGAVEALRKFATSGERIEVVGKVAYLHTPNGFGTSKLAEKFDKGIGVANTARNWNTVRKLMELAERVEAATE